MNSGSLTRSRPDVQESLLVSTEGPPLHQIDPEPRIDLSSPVKPTLFYYTFMSLTHVTSRVLHQVGPSFPFILTFLSDRGSTTPGTYVRLNTWRENIRVLLVMSPNYHHRDCPTTPCLVSTFWSLSKNITTSVPSPPSSLDVFLLLTFSFLCLYLRPVYSFLIRHSTTTFDLYL